MRSIPRSRALAGMVATVLAGCAGGTSRLLPAGGPSPDSPVLPAFKVKVGRATKRIPAGALRRNAATASPAAAQQIGPGYTASTSDGNGIAISADGADIYDYDRYGALLIDHDSQQIGTNGRPIYRMTGTNGIEVQIQLGDLAGVPYDQSTTLGDFTILQSSSTSLAQVSATVGDWGSLSFSAQPGDTGFTATAPDGQTVTYDYALFGISQTQAAAMRRAAQSGRRAMDFNPSAACFALIALLIALLLAAAYFGWYYIGLAYRLAALNPEIPYGVVAATLARSTLITAIAAVAGGVLGAAIIKECFKDPTPAPSPSAGGTATPTPVQTATPVPRKTTAP
ncbi:MAG: hypothetical protein QOI11_1357 [Candidatus Eremiobacteraeota bacterium]|jgi:hypothetical protein|nr:hypothetical protein [Candidatus Eremiobacteraeota bacterium]